METNNEPFENNYEGINNAILLTSPNAIVVTDLNGVVKIWNEAAEEMFGWKKGQIIGNYSHYIPQDKSDEANTVRARIMSGETIKGFETVRQNSEGNRIDVRFSASPFRDSQGEISGIIGIIENISKNKAVEIQLQTIMDNMLEGCQIIGYDWKYKYLNEAAVKDCRMDHSDLINHTLMECYPGIENTYLFSVLNECMEKRISRRIFNEFVYHDETSGYFNISISPVEQGLFLLTLDLTELIRAEEQIKLNDERFRQTFESANVGKSITQPNGEIHVNEALSEMLGYSRDELNKMKWQDITLPEDILRNEEILNLMISQKKNSARFEKTYIHKSGHKVCCDVSVKAIFDENNKLAYFITTVVDITEQKRIQEALQISEHKLRLFVEYAPAGIAMFDNELRFMAVSQRFLDDYRLDKNIIGLRQYDVFPEIPDRWKDIHKRCLDGETESVEKDSFTMDGSTVWVRWKITPWFEGENRIGGVILFSELITEKIKAQEALKESEDRFLKIFQSSPVGINIFDLTTGLSVDVNEAFLEIIGCSVNEVVGHSALELNLFEVPENRGKWIDILQKGNSVFNQDIKIKRKNGELRFAMASIETVEISGRKMGLVLATDITDRKIAEDIIKVREIEVSKMNETLEQRIAERTAELLDLYNNAPCGYHSLNSDGVFEMVNDTELHWLGYERNDLVNKIKAVDILTESSREIFRHNFPIFIKTGVLRDLELDFIRSNGSTLSVLLNATAVYDENGNFQRSRSTIVDHTARKKAEDSLKKALVRLEEANQELESFSYSVSHDLRAPLRAINGFTQILLEDYRPDFDDEGKRVCDVIQHNSDMMGRLIDDLLAFSRFGRSEINKMPMQMDRIIQSVIKELITPEIKDRTIVFMDELPEVKVDPSLMKQVWVNLLSNAIKYSSRQQQTIIKITSVIQDDRIVYSIKDNGIGFEMQYVDKLFGVFQRLHSETEFEGTGVGLAIVKRIINRHGGDVWAESRPGEGAVFSFSIPK